MSVDYDWMSTRGDEAADEMEDGKKLYGVVTGTVMPFLPDPQGLSRVRVLLDCIDSLDPIAWARVASPTAGIFSGAYFIPNPGDAVLIAFEHGELNAPYIIGALWHNISRPPVPLAELQTRTIRTLAGNQIVFQELPPSITIQTPIPVPTPIPFPPTPVGPSTIKASGMGVDITAVAITLTSGLSSISMDPTGITLKAGLNQIKLTPAEVDITAPAGGIKLNGAPGIDIKAPAVKIN